MPKALLMIVLCVYLPFASSGSRACADHLYLDPGKLGFFGGAVARMAGLTPPEPVFELEHPTMIKATINASSEVAVTYARPFFSRNVSLLLTGTANVHLPHSEFILADRDGTIRIPFELTGTGFDSIFMTIQGEHKGKNVLERARIYVRAETPTTPREMQVSERQMSRDTT